MKQLRFIRQAKELGFSLEEIREILRMRGQGQCPRGRVISLAERHLQNVENQIRRLDAFRQELNEALRKWKRSRTRQLSGDAFCVLIERTVKDADK